MSINPSYQSAIEDFYRMRRRASLKKIFNRFIKHTSLMSYEDVRLLLKAVEKSGTNLKEIPLNAIQGSVGRYSDFTRDFFPTESVDPQRWARVKAQFTALEGVPPIDVYKIGDVYFVSDGNHRVSVAKAMGNSTIDAYVREVSVRVPLDLDEEIDQLLIKAEYTEFLDKTKFDQYYPDVNLMVTAPGCYSIISQQIEAVHFSRELNENKSIPYSDAVRYWYDSIYYPIIESIREQNIIENFQERTETDLFFWICKHQARLRKTLDWDISPKSSAMYLKQSTNSYRQQFVNRSKQLLQKVIHHNAMDTGPPPGTWRRKKMSSPEGRLFANIIVVIDGSEIGWEAFSQSIYIAGHEGSELYGLYIADQERPISLKEQQTLQAEFSQRCISNDIQGQLAIVSGQLANIIKERAHWADLVVISQKGLNSKTKKSLTQFCPVPLLLSKSPNPELKSILLYYDGSLKSEEALSLAAYLTTFWELELTIITFNDKLNNHLSDEVIAHAKNFLENYGVAAQYLEFDHDPVMGIFKTAQDKNCDLILLGGFSAQNKNSPKNLVIAEVLVNSMYSIMVCR